MAVLVLLEAVADHLVDNSINFCKLLVNKELGRSALYRIQIASVNALYRTLVFICYTHALVLSLAA